MVACARLQVEPLVAIGAFDEMFVAHFQEHFGVSQGAATTIAGDAGLVGFDGFGNVNRHGTLSIR